LNLFPHTSKIKITIITIVLMVITYLLLLIPDPDPHLPPVRQSETIRPFFWNQDARWDSLEAKFVLLKRAGCETISSVLQSSLQNVEKTITQIKAESLQPTSPECLRLEEQFFTLAPLIATCPKSVRTYLALSSSIREALKEQSRHWDMTERSTRESLYRLLYGERSAVEEVILQLPPAEQPPPLLLGKSEPSATPAATLLGITIHSGDILVSRGGAPTSALIARGNDFQGNFSHVALVHVDSASGNVSIIESHIERGVAVATINDYLKDTKLRVMVLRLRSDLAALIRDPLLPHKAASAILARAQSQHIPYDFSMDYADSTELFCSEVASAAYSTFGIKLWMGMSYISSPGLRALLADFGVRHFETQEPSDLEYDPQLAIVAEWRDTETLRKDHIDNAATDAILEAAENGFRLRYDWYRLPFARIIKAYCVLQNIIGTEGLIPEVMTATSALEHEFYKSLHTMIVDDVQKASVQFRLERGINPPYWEMLRMARGSLQNHVQRMQEH
jgi:hypothetical protein